MIKLFLTLLLGCLWLPALAEVGKTHMFFLETIPTNFRPPSPVEQRAMATMVKVGQQPVSLTLDFAPLPGLVLDGILVLYRFPQDKPFWSATTITWPGQTCQEIQIHIPVDVEKANGTVILNELMGLAFQVALAEAGIDFCKQKHLTFKFRGKRWDLHQLSEAFSELSSEAKPGQVSTTRLANLEKITHPNYALIRQLAIEAKGDPAAYRRSVEVLIQQVMSENKKQ